MPLVTGKQSKGFSLLELMVVVAILGMMIAIAIPAFGVLTGADIKDEISTMMGTISESYDRSAILGKTHRLIIDLDKGEFYIQEKSTDAASFSPEIGYELDLEKKEDSLKDFRPQFSNVEGELGEKTALKKGVKFFGAWVEGMDEVKRNGIIAIYFFPSGYCQSAFISLAKQGDNIAEMYITISPLTGELSTSKGEPKIEDLLEEK